MAFVDTYAFEEVKTSGPAIQMVDTGRSVETFIGLLPKGRAMGGGEPTALHAERHPNLNGLVHGLSLEGERVLERVDDMLDARDPRLARAFLEEYEEMLSLPDDSSAASTRTERLLACYERLVTQGDCSPDGLIAAAANLGYTIQVRFGFYNKWMLSTGQLALVSLSHTTTWDRLYIYVTGGSNNAQLEAAINRLVPGHMEATYFYV